MLKYLLGILYFGLFSFAQAQTSITNFYQVTQNLYRGARPHLSPKNQIAELQTVGVKTVINLQGGDLNDPYFGLVSKWTEKGEDPKNIAIEKQEAEKLGLHFFNFPLNSFADIDLEESAAIDQILILMNDPNAQPVYIHCEHGADRTGMMVALYRVKYQGWSINRAHLEMTKRGHNRLHQIFTHDMDEYFYKKAKEIVRARSFR